LAEPDRRAAPGARHPAPRRAARGLAALSGSTSLGTRITIVATIRNDRSMSRIGFASPRGTMVARVRNHLEMAAQRRDWAVAR